MSAALDAVIADAYRVFAGYSIGSALVVCNCNCCMSKENERALTNTALAEIPASLLAEYTNSAHAWDDGQVACEMRYFLPRYLELIAANDPPDSLGLDICLRRLSYARWRETWPAAEREVLDRFFDALIAASVERLELAHWPVGWRLEFDLADILTLAITAGGDIDRVLAAWDGAADPPAAIHMAALRRWVMTASGRTYLHSAYLEAHQPAADSIGAFLMRSEVDARIEDAYLAVDDERLREVIAQALG